MFVKTLMFNKHPVINILIDLVSHMYTTHNASEKASHTTYICSNIKPATPILVLNYK